MTAATASGVVHYVGSVYYRTPTIARPQIVDELALRRIGLTPRERDVLIAIAQGLSNREAGAKLFLSDQTVKFHLHRIYRKLQVGNRTEAAHRAHSLGLLMEKP